DTSRWSVISYFNTIPPPAIGVPALVSPAQAAKNIPLTPLLLSWNFSANALSFDIEISTTEDFSNIVASGNAQGNASQFSGMQAKTRYYWRVRGRNGNFTSAWATRWFETAPPTSIEEVNISQTLVFPNPATSFISVRTKGQFAVEVRDINGRMVFEQTFVSDEVDLQTESWKAGLYVVRIIKPEGQSIHKVWVQP
ncbi:MAG: T9SS type A sorting domain-containing protein, partial [Bacteroidia bacterium]|nr:T9SS type A sorting domain-containing protein [Bacteroidia bacterium]